MVLLKIFPRRYGVDNNIEVQSINVEDDKCYIDHIYNGIDKLRFEVPNSDENYRKYIEEESKVIPSGLGTERKFVVKNIDDHSNFAVVDCEIDLDDWKSNVFIDFRTTNSTISQVLSQIIPTGWTVFYDNNVDTSKRTTVEYQEGEPFRCATAYIIMGYVSEAYDVVFNYHNDIKQLSVIAPSAYENSGEFFVEELNMKEIGFNGDSSNYISRVYAYGKKDEDGNYVTIESVNDGKQYVEDLSYTGKIISSSVVDERYTVPQNLKEYAEKVLHNNCMPVRSYKCSVINFNEDMWLYKVVTIIDRVKKLRIEHQCAEYREYKNHSLDEITLSTTEPSIVKKYEEINVNTDTKINQLQTRFQGELDVFSDLVENASGLYKTEVVQQDESVLTYYHDKRDLAESQIRILISDVGITVTSDGGTTWYGLQVDGQLLARILSVSGINADWINTGVLSIEDGSGNEVFYADVDTGEVRMTGNVIMKKPLGNAQFTTFTVKEFIGVINNVANFINYSGTGFLVNNQDGTKFWKLALTSNSSGDNFNQVVENINTAIHYDKIIYFTSYKKGYIVHVSPGIPGNRRSGIQLIPFADEGETAPYESIELIGNKIDVKTQELSFLVYAYRIGTVDVGRNSGKIEINDVSDSSKPYLGIISKPTQTSPGLFTEEDRIELRVPSGNVLIQMYYHSLNRYDKYIQFIAGGVEISVNTDGTFILTNGLPEKITNSSGVLINNTKRRELVGDYNYLSWNGNNLAYDSSSSKRYKHDIEELKDNKLDPHKLLELSVKQFIYNKGVKLQYQDMENQLLPGFIAEEVAEIYPSAVIRNVDTGEIESWDERRIVPGMLVLIKEQHYKIKEQEEKIQSLEERLEKLEKIIMSNIDDDWR